MSQHNRKARGVMDELKDRLRGWLDEVDRLMNPQPAQRQPVPVPVPVRIPRRDPYR